MKASDTKNFVQMIDRAAGAVLHEELPKLIRVNGDAVCSSFYEESAELHITLDGYVPIARIHMAGGEAEIWPLFGARKVTKTGELEPTICLSTVPYEDPGFTARVAAVVDKAVQVYYRNRG